MKKLLTGLTAIAAFAMTSHMALAQGTPSAKFAAVWSDTTLMAKTTAKTCNEETDRFFKDTDAGVLLATMKMPTGKEIFVGVSAESVIRPRTTVKGKNGGSGTASATGTVAVRIKAVNVDTGEIYPAVPNGRIVLNARVQTLSATLGGVIESCTTDEEGNIVVADDCTVTNEEIGLITRNASANHFDVIFPDLPAGVYQIRARFVVTSTSEASVVGDACAFAGSYVALGDRIVTLQDVRAVKGEFEAVEVQ